MEIKKMGQFWHGVFLESKSSDGGLKNGRFFQQQISVFGLNSNGTF